MANFNFPASPVIDQVYTANEVSYMWDGTKWKVLAGTLPVANGGTGATTAPDARTNLGATTLGSNLFTLTNPSAVTFPRLNADNSVSALDSASFRTAIGAGTGSGTVSSVAVTVPNFLSVSGSPITTSGTIAISYSGVALPVLGGGTGATSFTANNVLLGNGTSAFQSVAPGTSGNVLTSNGTTWTSAAAGASLSGQTDSASPFETSLGSGAGAVNTGVNNTFIGFETGNDNTTGASNTAVGYQALDANTTGESNVALGSNALGANTTGIRNVAIGDGALPLNTEGNENVAIGKDALRSTTANGNNSVGYLSMFLTTTGAFNNTFGRRAMFSNTSGNYNCAFGNDALYANTTGTNNIAVGHQALDANTTGENNVALGSSALGANTTGVNNTAIGFNSLGANSTGTNNTAVGYGSLDANTTGVNNVAIGLNALGANTTGLRSVAIGVSALGAKTTNPLGDPGDVAIGYQALAAASTSSYYSTAVGYRAGASNTSNSHTAIGSLAAELPTGVGITAVGAQALRYASNGAETSAVGAESLLSVSTGTANTSLGYLTGRSVDTGSQNVLLGARAGYSGTNDLTTGSNNIILGYNAAASSATVSNEVTIGNSSVNRFRIPGLGIDWTTSSIPGPSSMTKISTITCSAGAVATFTGLTGYNRYLLVFESIQVASASNGVRFRVGYGSPVTYISSDYAYVSLRNATNTTAGAAASSTGTEGLLAIANSSTHTFNGSFMIAGMQGDDVIAVTGNMSNTSVFTMTGHSTVKNPGLFAMTALQIFGSGSASGFNSGRITLYGLS